MKNEVKSSEIKNVSPAKHFDETFLKFDAQTFPKFVIAIASLAVLAALCTTASAGGYGSGCPFSNWYNGTVHGGIYIDVKGHYNSNSNVTQTYTFENVPNGRKIVRLYPGIWLGSPSSGRVTNWSLTINDNLENFNFTEPSSLPFCDWDIPPEDGTGEHCKVSFSGCGVCSLTYNASPYIVTGTNTITYWTSEQIYHVALLVVYENESMPEMQYWIKEGHEKPDSAPYFVYFNETSNTDPIVPENISSVEYYTCGYPHCVGESGWPYLNENYIDACDYVYSYDASGDVYEGSPPGKEFEVLYRWDNIPPGYINSSSNHFRYPTLGNDRLMVPVLVLKYAPKLPDLVITDTWVNWPTNCTICYNLMNTGTLTAPALHNTTLYVDGTRIVNDTVPVVLEPDASYIGCFDYTWTYTPPEDNITVCADSNNDVDEGSGESNNCRTNWWKCGDVNNDRYINVQDAIQAYYKVPSLNKWAADVTADGGDKTINVQDAIRIYYKSNLNCW